MKKYLAPKKKCLGLHHHFLNNEFNYNTSSFTFLPTGEVNLICN
jgi:hypothetical protein